MSTLYELTGQILELMNMAQEDDLNDEQVFKDTFEAVEGEFEDKADAYVKVIKELDDKKTALKAEIDRLSGRMEILDKNIERMQKVLENAMRVAKKPKFSTLLFSYSIDKNPPAVFIEDESKVPEIYWKAGKPKIDKTAIKKFLEKADLMGGCDWAHLTQGETLHIK